jgi:hypothetical protein
MLLKAQLNKTGISHLMQGIYSIHLFALPIHYLDVIMVATAYQRGKGARTFHFLPV